MELLDRIEINPRICNVRPVIKGTRIPVSVILEQLAESKSRQTVISGYPELQEQDIQAALHYEGMSLDHIMVRKRKALGGIVIEERKQKSGADDENSTNIC